MFVRTPPGSSAELRRSRLRAALDGSGTGAWIWELSTRNFFCDTVACRNLGVGPGKVLSLDDLFERVYLYDRPRVEAAMLRASLSDQPFELTTRIATADDSIRYVVLEGSPELDARGAPIRFNGALRDVTEERRRTDELRRHSQILAQVHDAIFAATPSGRILSWNPAAERVYGYSPSEAIGRRIHMLWFEDDQPGLGDNLSAARLASGAHEFVSRVRHKSGAALYAQFRLAPMRNEDGQTVGLLACSSDVTQQREEHELVKMQAGALENIGDAVIVTDQRGTILHANQAALGLCPRKAGGLLGVRMAELFSGLAAEARKIDQIRETLLGGDEWLGELSFLSAASAPLLARTSVRRIELESAPVWVWVLQDITEQRRAEAALIERERRFRTLADSAPMEVWMTDAHGNCEYVNKTWLERFGRPCEKALGAGWLEVVHPDDRARLQELIRCTPGAEPFELEMRMLDRTGQNAHILTRAAPRVENGQVVGFIGSGVDITNIRKAEEERIQLEQQALKSQKLYSLGVLAGGIAHDFNNMLVSILGFSDLALHELEPRHPARTLVEQIELGSRRAAGLVEQVLTFAGKARRATEEVDLNQAVLETANLLELSLSEGVRLDLQLASELESLYADPAQVRQVVMNLLLNASDVLSQTGGCIRIRTAFEEIAASDPREWADAPPEPGPYVLLEVSDDGDGMNPDTLTQIFDPFFTTKFTGRGLGLSAVMGVVRSHSGAISVRSELGGGSCFTVFFPLERPVLPARPERQAAVSGDLSVLVVDDDRSVLDVTRHMLQSGGLQVHAAQSADEAVALFSQGPERVRLVILDVVMPDAAPANVAARLRELRDDVQILLASGYSDSDLRPAIDGRTFVGFIAKPYNRDELLEAVARACPSIVNDLAKGSASA
ncbi:MAG: PAS domain S-box protein [Acidobacteria bacterium]|nr:PAS domain S-box protein [Acidobacteriota bacterium]